MKPLIIILSIVCTIACSRGETPSRETMYEQGTPFVKVQARRLADMNIPRNTHLMHIVNGEPVIIGGHTTGFIPSPTAEWFDGQNWHATAMTYPHDGGFATPLSDGTLLVGGGSGDSFGIGQSWGVEAYHPDTHSFEPVGILDRKRAYASALTLPSDTVIVSGNWYADDAIEMYAPGELFSTVKDVSQRRFYPLILPVSEEDVIIFGGYDSPWKGAPLQYTVDRLRGEPFEAGILKEWIPAGMAGCNMASDCRIKDYTYLIPASRFPDKAPGIIKVDGESFSILDTERPIPCAGPDGEEIFYCGFLEVDRSTRHAFLPGVTQSGKVYVADIGYDATLDGGKASVRMLYSKVDSGLGLDFCSCLTPEGNLLMTGGFLQDNFHPSAATFLVMLTPPQEGRTPLWIIITAILIIILSAVFIILRSSRKAPQDDVNHEEEGKGMMARIIALMEEEQLFRMKDLRVAELASRLGTNTTYISACINGQIGQTFNEFVTSYRIRYAQTLIKENPQMLMSQVCEESGFTSERSFFRNFKAVTGLTPTEWKEKN